MEQQNQPLDWTDAEVEKFVAVLKGEVEQETGILTGNTANNGTWVSDVRIVNRGIHITSITPPEQGWPIAAHCVHCRKTVIVLSPYAIKPEKGDYWMLKGTCLDEELHIKHNLYAQPFEFKPLDPLPDWPKDWIEYAQEMSIEEARKHYLNTPIPKDTK